jgi:hypothetical protein
MTVVFQVWQLMVPGVMKVLLNQLWREAQTLLQHKCLVVPCLHDRQAYCGLFRFAVLMFELTGTADGTANRKCLAVSAEPPGHHCGPWKC